MEIINFDSWNVYEGSAEGSGRSEKIWLKSPEGKIGLFKFPKIDPAVNKETTEHISEHLAYLLGQKLGVATAKVDIGTYKGRFGSMSYLVCDNEEILREGIWYISGKYPKYNCDSLMDEDSGEHYCLEHLYGTIPSVIPNHSWIQMLVFDFLIGNADRHQSNWAILEKKQDKYVSQVKWCPLYDNGSSLCCYENSLRLEKIFSNDKNVFKALVDSKSKSMIRISGTDTKNPTHREMVRHLLEKYSITKEIANDFIDRLSEQEIELMLSDYSDDLLDPQKKKLIYLYLCEKINILKSLLKEV